MCTTVSQEMETCEPHRVKPDDIEGWKTRIPPVAYLASVFKLMGDETRLSLLYLLSQGEFCVHDLAYILGSSVSNVSHHLRLLRAMRLVKSRRQGQKICYELDDEHVEHLLQEAFKHASHS